MQTIGERLEDARNRKNLSIKDVAEATKIRGDYLQHFESNKFDVRLPDIYVRGFLRNYARHLGLSGDKIVDDYNALNIAEEHSHRGFNREHYGRMSLPQTPRPESGFSSQDSDESAPSSTPQAAPETAKSPSATHHHPGSSIVGLERVLLLKTSTLAIIAAVLLALIIWGIVAFFSHNSSPALANAAEKSMTAIADIRAGEVPIDIVTVGPTSLIVTRQSDGSELYRSTEPLPTGFRVTLPKVSVRIEASAVENIRFDFQGKSLRIPNRTGPLNSPLDLGAIR